LIITNKNNYEKPSMHYDYLPGFSGWDGSAIGHRCYLP
jgi:hypothetical protein